MCPCVSLRVPGASVPSSAPGLPWRAGGVLPGAHCVSTGPPALLPPPSRRAVCVCLRDLSGHFLCEGPLRIFEAIYISFLRRQAVHTAVLRAILLASGYVLGTAHQAGAVRAACEPCGGGFGPLVMNQLSQTSGKSRFWFAVPAGSRGGYVQSPHAPSRPANTTCSYSRSWPACGVAP